MKFIHTADLHLGRVFYGHHLIEDQKFLLNQIIDLTKKEKPHALLISGDVYDRASPPAAAIKLLNEFLTKIIKEVKIPVIMIAGNHDSPDRMEFGSDLFHEFHVRGTLHKHCKAVLLKDEHDEVYFYPLPYQEPIHLRLELENAEIKTHNDAMKYYIEDIKSHHPKNKRAVLLAHCFVQNARISDSERTLSIGGAEQIDNSLFSSFSYTALGHLHRSQSFENNVHYSGSLMKYSLSEYNHSKSINLVEIDKIGNTSVKKILLKPKRDLHLLQGTFKEILSESKKKNKDFNEIDFFYIRLNDESPVIDAVNKLRKFYPNIVHLDYPKREELKIDIPDFSFENINTLELFKEFYSSITKKQMNAKEVAVIANTLETIEKNEREL